jgi:hypothetical protein
VSQLSAAVPEGWAATESLEVVAGDGGGLLAQRRVAETDATAETFAERHAATLDERLPNRRVETPARGRAFGTDAAIVVGYEWDTEDGTTVAVCNAYAIVDGFACVASATQPGTTLGEARSRLAELVDGVTVWSSPLRPPAANGRDAEADTAAAGGSWHALRERWERPETVTMPAPSLVATADELQVLASLVGAETFPGVDPRWLGTLDGDAREAAFGVATRSLIARGVLRRTETGVAAHDDLAAVLDVARSPQLLVSAEHRPAGAPHPTAMLFATTADAAIALAGAGDEAIVVGRCAPGDVVDHALAFVQLAGQPAAPDPPTPTVAAADVDGTDATTPVSRVRTMFRDGSAFVGGELTWLERDGGLLRAEPTADGGYALEPADATRLRAALLEYLPPAR